MKKSVNTCFYGLLEAACITVLKSCSAAFPLVYVCAWRYQPFVLYAAGADGKMGDPMWVQILRCTLFVVSLEFITGIIVNKWLGAVHLGLYRPALQLFGQICLPFAIIFSGCAPAGSVLEDIWPTGSTERFVPPFISFSGGGN